MAEAAAEEKMTVPVASGIPLKVVIMIVAAAMLIGLGGAYVLFRMTAGSKAVEDTKAEVAADKSAGHQEAGKKGGHGVEPGAIADLEPFIVNLADTPEIRYLKLNVKLELDRSEATEEVKVRTPQIRDSILVLLTSKDSAAIRSPQGKAQLREEITQRINGLLPRPGVRSAYFTEFVIQ
jgi:flagellar FliL protein